MAAPSTEQAQIRERVVELCARIALAHPLPLGNAWAAQIDWLNAQASDLLRAVVPLLPDEVRVPIEHALAHQQTCAIGAPDNTPLGDISYLDD